MTQGASVREQRRNAVLVPICEYLLASGLDDANLRALAQAAGTSDRMLLYYFTDKDDLISAALQHLGQQLADRLAAALPTDPMNRDELLEAIWSAVQTPPLWTYLLLFVEIVARAARGDMLYQRASRIMTEHFLAWVARHLVSGESENQAIDVLATIDGRVLLKIAQTELPAR